MIPHGPEQERSDIRVHVCIEARQIYIFSREAAIEIVQEKMGSGAKGFPVYTGDIKTAFGYPVPWEEIRDIIEIPFPDSIPEYELAITASTSEKGRYAEDIWVQMSEEDGQEIYKKLIEKGIVSANISPRKVDDIKLQKSGIDTEIRIPEFTAQVKCDYRGGSKEHGGTGNLFIQIFECNPYEQH